MKTTWQTKKLGEICDLQNGFAFKSKDYVSNSNTMNFRMSQIQPNGSVDLENNPKFLPDTYVETYKNFLLKDGDVVVAMTDLATQTKILGVPTIVKTNGKKLLLNQRVGKLIKIDPSVIYLPFLRYALTTPQVSEYYKRLGRGGLQINISKQEVLNVQINYPSVTEQKRIVKKLDAIFENIDKAKENTEKNLQNSKDLFASCINNLFGKLNNDWDEKKLKDIGHTQTGSTPKTSIKEYLGTFIPFVKPADVDFLGNGTVRYENEGLSENGLKVSRKIKKNSVLMVCIGATIGKVGFVTEDVTCNQQINTLTPESKYNPKIFYYIMRTESFFSKIINGSSQATLPIINKSKWENISIFFPNSKVEQDNIVKKLDELSEQTKKLEENYKRKLLLLSELKKSVLAKAFAGEL